MPRRASFVIIFLLPLFSQFCFGEQPAPGSTAAMSGLRGPVRSVFTENFIYGDNGEKRPGGFSRGSTYDRAGYETELYEYDVHGLRSHTVYTRSDGHLVKAEITNPFSKQESVQLCNSDGFVTETDTYNDNGVLTAKTANDSSVKKATSTVSVMRATDGSISTTERFADGSFKESTVKPDGTTVVHFHSQHADWRQATDANNRSLEYIEEPSTGEYLRILSRYDRAGREIGTTTYDRSRKVLSETTLQYSQEDEHGNWLEKQVWGRTASKPEMLHQVIHRTITYYRTPDGGER